MSRESVGMWLKVKYSKMSLMFQVFMMIIV